MGYPSGRMYGSRDGPASYTGRRGLDGRRERQAKGGGGGGRNALDGDREAARPGGYQETDWTLYAVHRQLPGEPAECGKMRAAGRDVQFYADTGLDADRYRLRDAG